MLKNLFLGLYLQLWSFPKNEETMDCSNFDQQLFGFVWFNALSILKKAAVVEEYSPFLTIGILYFLFHFSLSRFFKVDRRKEETILTITD